ncbi:MAG: leucine-rich repeat domain-containing protein [Bacteroidales bacterium]|nr:leucine-rich repeat domain-containing protein [Bacteroidales bacterium]
MKNNHPFLWLVLILLGSAFSACKPEPSSSDIVSTRELNHHGIVYVEALCQNGAKWYFEIESATTAWITSSQDFFDDDSVHGCYAGALAVPETFEHYGQTYTITGVKPLTFVNCEELTSMTLPNTVTVLGEGAFYGCTNLHSVVLPEGIQWIDFHTFNNCSSLTYLKVPDAVEGIYMGAFFNCSSLEKIELGSGLQSCAGMLFIGCSSLKTVISHAVTPPSLVESTFNGLPLQEILVPKEGVEAYKNAPVWSDYADIIQPIQ